LRILAFAGFGAETAGGIGIAIAFDAHGL